MTEVIPDVHSRDKIIPKGKVLLRDGPAPLDEMVHVTLLDEDNGLRILAISAGWALAGARLRWDNGCFAVRRMVDGAIHGRKFSNYADAVQYFNALVARHETEG